MLTFIHSINKHSIKCSLCLWIVSKQLPHYSKNNQPRTYITNFQFKIKSKVPSLNARFLSTLNHRQLSLYLIQNKPYFPTLCMPMTHPRLCMLASLHEARQYPDISWHPHRYNNTCAPCDTLKDTRDVRGR